MNNNISLIQIKDKYLEFPGTIDPDQARAIFERRFKYAPEVVEMRGWALWVGPVKEEQCG